MVGTFCKSTSKSNLKRYVGTKGWKCIGGDNYYESRNSTECSNKCGGNIDEICGDRNHIIIYDTWTQSGLNQRLIYIFVPVGIVVVVVAVLIAFLVIKRKRNAVSKNGVEVNRIVQVHRFSVQSTTAKSCATKEGSIQYIDPPDGGYEMPERNNEHLNSVVVNGDTYSQLEMIASSKGIAAKEESVYQNTCTNPVSTDGQDGCGELSVDERSYEHLNTAMVQDFTYSRLGSKEATNT